MNGLLELVFKGGPACNIGPLTMKLLNSEANIIDMHRDGDEFLPAHFAFDISMWNEFSLSNDDVAIFINFKKLDVGLKAISSAALQLVHHKNFNDITVLFSTENCREVNLIFSDDIYQWASQLAQNFNVVDFFGGLEPAEDKHTQIFSSSAIGPIVEV